MSDEMQDVAFDPPMDFEEGMFDYIMGNKFNCPTDEPHRTFYSSGWEKAKKDFEQEYLIRIAHNERFTGL